MPRVSEHAGIELKFIDFYRLMMHKIAQKNFMVADAMQTDIRYMLNQSPYVPPSNIAAETNQYDVGCSLWPESAPKQSQQKVMRAPA